MEEFVILLPVYEDGECLSELLRAIASIPMPAARILVVDDGSVHAPPDLRVLGDAGFRGDVVRLNHNLGQQRAIAVGLTLLHGSSLKCPVLVMDADGQDRADAIPELIRRFENSDAEIVVARRGHRTESLTFRVLYRLYTMLFRLLTGHTMNFGCFALLSNSAVSRLVAMPELTIHFAASVLSSGLSLEFVSVDRGHRFLGASRMNFLSRLQHAGRSIIVFIQPLLLRVGLFWCAVAGLFLVITDLHMNQLSESTPAWFIAPTDWLIVIFNLASVALVLSMIVAGIMRVTRRMNSADVLLQRAVTVKMDKIGKRPSRMAKS